MLGSSAASATIAGNLGLRFCFAAFIRPHFATDAFEAYREQFQRTDLPGSVEEPTGMVALNVVCAETDQQAARQRAVAEAVFRRMQRGERPRPLSVEAAIDELGEVPEPTPTALPADEWPRAISGSPETVAGLLDQLANRVGVDELMVQQTTDSHEATLRSHELLAERVD